MCVTQPDIWLSCVDRSGQPKCGSPAVSYCIYLTLTMVDSVVHSIHNTSSGRAKFRFCRELRPQQWETCVGLGHRQENGKSTCTLRRFDTELLHCLKMILISSASRFLDDTPRLGSSVAPLLILC